MSMFMFQWFRYLKYYCYIYVYVQKVQYMIDKSKQKCSVYEGNKI